MWDKIQKKQFAKTAKNLWGNGWSLLSKHQQECAVAGIIMRTIMMQVGPEFDGLKDLIRGVMQEAGVWEEK